MNIAGVRKVGHVWMVRKATSALHLSILAFTLAFAFVPIAFSQAPGGATPAQSDGVRSLLHGLRPKTIQGVLRSDVLTDDVFVKQGDFWSTDRTSVFASSDSFVVYDLGRSRPIRTGILQGDNNDRYIIALSDDGVRFVNIWSAPETTSAGMQARFSRELHGSGRFVRVSAAGGDGAYSLSEVQLFTALPADVPRPQMIVGGVDNGESARTHILLLALALVVFAFIAYQKAHPLLVVAGVVVLAVEAYFFCRALSMAWPVSDRDVAFVRGAVAAVAAIVVGREVWLVGRFRANQRVVLGILALCAVVSIAAFYNLGKAQYWDHKEQKPGYVHNYDMHVYYPVAKYFDELGFDGLYVASIQAYIENVPGASVTSLADVELRDLKTHYVRRVADVAKEMNAVKARFSPERWEEFKKDIRYFHENMGSRDFLGNMIDHGGNATPVWLAIGHLLFAHTEASNRTLLWGAVLDPILLLLLIVVVWRTFGVRTALMTAILFGANDFYMFGTNWAGATLRHDWLVYLGLGICALRTERWMLGGALLALSTMIRAFPVLALMGTGVPVLFWLWNYRQSHGKLPSIRRWREFGSMAPFSCFFRISLGAVASVMAFFLFSAAVCSFGAWIAWLHKIVLLNSGSCINAVSLRCLVGGMGEYTCEIYRERWIFYAVLVAVFVIGVLAASYRRRFDQAAILGVFLVPVVVNPANYYIHFICLIPLLANEIKRTTLTQDKPAVAPREVFNWLVLLFVCVAQYWTVLDKDIVLHFQHSTFILFSAITVLLVNLIFWRTESATDYS